MTQPKDDFVNGVVFTKRIVEPSPDLFTDGGYGDHRRLRVDVGQTGFFAGREFRTFHEFDIATSSEIIIKVEAASDTIVMDFGASIDLGEIRVELKTGGTEGGTFGTSLPIFRTNQMSVAPTPTAGVTMTTGGTHTGGTIAEVFTAISGDKIQKASSAVASEQYPLGFPAGTYYIRIQNTDGANAKGIFTARWEDRP